MCLCFGVYWLGLVGMFGIDVFLFWLYGYGLWVVCFLLDVG